VRDFIFDLRPMMLDDLGVVPTVRRYVNSFKEKTDIEANLEIIGEERRLENHREVMLFRSVQELMGHARDHASATDLNVRLDISGNPVKIVVQDNGRGFDASTLFSENEANQDSRSRDIVTIKEKFELIGGSISVSSSEEEGTVIHLQLPTGD
jgi:two-component system sensor histidine kinase DegS